VRVKKRDWWQNLTNQNARNRRSGAAPEAIILPKEYRRQVEEAERKANQAAGLTEDAGGRAQAEAARADARALQFAHSATNAVLEGRVEEAA